MDVTLIVNPYASEVTQERVQVVEQELAPEVVERLRLFMERRSGQRLVVVSHATPIAILTQLGRGEEPVTVGEFWAGVENGCVRRIIAG